MKTIIPFLMSILLLGCNYSQPKINSEKEIHGIVSDVIDGDTLYVLVKSNIYKIRLQDIDCPEKKQPYGKEAKQFVENLALSNKIVVKYKGTDRYGRTIGTAIIVTNMANLNQELLKNGWAWWYYQYSTNQMLGNLEEIARTNKLGIWASTNNIPPWEWRKKHR